jgi:hypothetical protein
MSTTAEQLEALDEAIACDRARRDRAGERCQDGVYRFVEAHIEALISVREIIERGVIS